MKIVFKAAILEKLRSPLRVENVVFENKLGVGQVLVRVKKSGICGSQIGELNGVKGYDNFLPHLMGHEGSGFVEKIGPGISHVKVGDAVVLHWRPSKGIQSRVPEYHRHGERVNAGWVTTFNEYAVVSENRLTVIPDESDLEISALMGCAVTTGFGVIQNNASVSIGQSVVVFGAGGVGLNIIQAAQLRGAFPIIAVDVFDNRLELAKNMGAHFVINAKACDAFDKISLILGGSQLDHFIDNTGKPEIIEKGYSLVSSKGCVTLVGVPKSGDNIRIHTLPLHFGKQISGSHGGESSPSEDIPNFMKLYKQGLIQLDSLITHRVNLDDINDAMQAMVSGEVSGRVMIDL